MPLGPIVFSIIYILMSIYLYFVDNCVAEGGVVVYSVIKWEEVVQKILD